jgi:iron-sulfur cluster repair protein YtfE (RIC family)
MVALDRPFRTGEQGRRQTAREATMSMDLRHGAEVERRFVESEHREMLPGIGRIDDVAGLAGSLAAPDLSASLRSVLDWLHKSFLPHCDWEDSWLYPELDRIAGTPWVTRSMRFDHRQIRELIDRLEIDWELLRREPTHRHLGEIRARLYALHALIHCHVEREERFLVPLLDATESHSTAATA